LTFSQSLQEITSNYADAERNLLEVMRSQIHDKAGNK